jgi:serine/threonine protein kinase
MDSPPRVLPPGTTVGRYSIIHLLSPSSQFSVYLAEHLPTRLSVAMKCIPRSLVSSEGCATRFTREINLVQQMNHPFIAKLFDVIEDPVSYFLIFEFAERGSLAELLSSQGALPEPHARRCFAELVCALNHLHNVSCVPHRDLHPRHVLFDGRGHVRLIDFGLSHIFGKHSPLSASSPPELLGGERYTTHSDIWNCGVLLSAMISGELPPAQTTVFDLRRQIARPRVPIPRAMSPLAMELVGSLLRQPPEERLSLAQIITHDWMAPAYFVDFFRGRLPMVDSKDVSATLATFGYAIPPEDIGRNPELRDLCQIIERKILAERMDAQVRDNKIAIRFGRERFGRPTTPPPATPESTGAPAPPAEPPRARPHGNLAHAVTAPPVRPGTIRRRPRKP